VKTLLAIGRKAEDAHIVLIEEPENHLSFSSMRRLIADGRDKTCGQRAGAALLVGWGGSKEAEVFRYNADAVVDQFGSG